MLTDLPPRDSKRSAAFWRSDRLDTLALPPDDRFQRAAAAVEAALLAADRSALAAACEAFSAEIGAFYGVAAPQVRVLAARPLTVYGDGGTAELFGDYEFDSGRIRVWMRTAVQKRVTSFGTFFSTLCHEICHHLDVVALGFPATPHTRGFYARTACLYHHARGTPPKPLAWIAQGKDRWRIDWAAMRAR